MQQLRSRIAGTVSAHRQPRAIHVNQPAAATAAVILLTALTAVAAPAAAQDFEGRFERTLTVSAPVDLSLHSGAGSITVEPGASGSVRIVGTIRANRWRAWRESNVEARIKKIEAQPPIVQEGGRITVGKTDDDDLYEHISISYDVVVPDTAQVKTSTGSGSVRIGALRGPVSASSGSGSLTIGAIGGAVEVSTGSGEIKVDGAKDRVEARSGSGSIYLRNIAGAATANSGSGSIEVDQTAPGTVRASNGSGSIRLAGVRGGLVAHSSSGSIRVEGTPTQPWELNTSSGSIHMFLPAEAKFSVDAHTGSGSINVEHPITVQGAVNKRRLQGNVGGGGATVAAHTSSGSIDINAGSAPRK